MPLQHRRRVTGLRVFIALVAVAPVLLVGWAAYERASCRAAIAKFEKIQRTHSRNDVLALLGTPNAVFAGADVLTKRHWGTVEVGPNEGQVVRDERYWGGRMWCSYLIVIGYGPDGSVQSKFIYH
jgi:hypothetical protein